MCVIFRFVQNRFCLKNVSNVLVNKRRILHLLKNRLMFVSFFSLPLRIHREIESSWKNHLIWTAGWGGERNTPDTQNRFIIFLSEIAVMKKIFWTEDYFYFISRSSPPEVFLRKGVLKIRRELYRGTYVEVWCQ